LKKNFLFKLKVGAFAVVTAACSTLGLMGGETVKAATNGINIYLAGDSTVCDWDTIKGVGYYEPQAGWGQMLSTFFDDTVTVVNGAISGYSSKTFYLGCASKADYVRHLDDLLKNASAGDYLLVQFGHNDSTQPTEEQLTTRPDIAERYVTPEEFKLYLERYIVDAQAKGVTPILVTPCGRYSIGADGKFKSNFTAYVNAMKELAADKNVYLIDLDAKSREYYDSLGEEGAKSVFLFVDKGAYPDSYYAEGVEDKTHFQKFGATQLARLIAEGMQELGLTDLTERMTSNVARPESAPGVPQNMKVITDKGRMFTFTWDPVEGADLYTIYRVVTMANGAEIKSVVRQISEPKCVFTELEVGKEYTYYVVSKNMVGESEASERVVRTGASNNSGNKERNDLVSSETDAKEPPYLLIGIIAAAVVVVVVIAIFVSKSMKKRAKRKEDYYA